ncbi:16S rRNA (guanine(966)-N(2))-methyltransferase RsmD [Tepidanaerobacter acetatoxydans]|uniref:16S rRNA (guanine(966)-N(2))-methyltransferase RsmD n=1 Tax=Tepidanaerobacter acetatoxydans TaxID=499229 RepID=UPI001BD3AF28|nr:16S rRNA (guanine(966)-N(2))-methyltransferase RsmD [Tepidanaerobacter acetatoxydans]
MRIIGGFHRGRKIKSISGMNTRPTSDFVREALFNIIGSDVVGSCFLDLFAGTGAVGIEALSRGAQNAIFIEKNPIACSIIKQNLLDLKLIGKGRVIQSDVISALKKLILEGNNFDIIFMDPPYFKNNIGATLDILKDFNVTESIIIIQHPKDELLKFDGFACCKHKQYGRTALTFLTKE